MTGNMATVKPYKEEQQAECHLILIQWTAPSLPGRPVVLLLLICYCTGN